mmetsp:Transcript_422/g.1175  ORF Transcript_422/g.1175 Transcript_422/m.1175 type:complete len:341 (+) Transcript_422:1333-2355(+)
MSGSSTRAWPRPSRRSLCRSSCRSASAPWRTGCGTSSSWRSPSSRLTATLTPQPPVATPPAAPPRTTRWPSCRRCCATTTARPTSTPPAAPRCSTPPCCSTRSSSSTRSPSWPACRISPQRRCTWALRSTTRACWPSACSPATSPRQQTAPSCSAPARRLPRCCWRPWLPSTFRAGHPNPPTPRVPPSAISGCCAPTRGRASTSPPRSCSTRAGPPRRWRPRRPWASSSRPPCAPSSSRFLRAWPARAGSRRPPGCCTRHASSARSPHCWRRSSRRPSPRPATRRPRSAWPPTTSPRTQPPAPPVSATTRTPFGRSGRPATRPPPRGTGCPSRTSSASRS